MVLIGHSMGGLVAQMQVTYSGDIIWQAAATRPFNTIVTDPATRADLAAAFFFQPSPDISRVIYIATPHRGSSDATRCVGRISSALIEEPPDWAERHAQLVRDNPDAFRDELQREDPNSIDLLEPDSLILQATERLPYRHGVGAAYDYRRRPLDARPGAVGWRGGGVECPAWRRAKRAGRRRETHARYSACRKRFAK